MEEIEYKIKNLISSTWNLPLQNIHCESCFPDDLAADSLDIVELVMEMEKEFKIEIPDEDIEKIVTVSAAVNYISIRLKTR